MIKAFADLTDAGHSVNIIALLHEACMAHNTLLCHSGVPPISGVLGQLPKDLTDMANKSPSALAMSDPPDLLERSIVYRQHACASSLRAVAETRIARAQHGHERSSFLAVNQCANAFLYLSNLFKRSMTS